MGRHYWGNLLKILVNLGIGGLVGYLALPPALQWLAGRWVVPYEGEDIARWEQAYGSALGVVTLIALFLALLWHLWALLFVGRRRGWRLCWLLGDALALVLAGVYLGVLGGLPSAQSGLGLALALGLALGAIVYWVATVVGTPSPNKYQPWLALSIRGRLGL